MVRLLLFPTVRLLGELSWNMDLRNHVRLISNVADAESQMAKRLLIAMLSTDGGEKKTVNKTRVLHTQLTTVSQSAQRIRIVLRSIALSTTTGIPHVTFKPSLYKAAGHTMVILTAMSKINLAIKTYTWFMTVKKT